MPLQDREWHRIYQQRQTRRAPRIIRDLTIRRMTRFLTTFLKLVFIVLILGYAATIFLHLTNGFDLRTSMSAEFQDVRLAVTCPHRIETLWRFIDRSQLEQDVLNAALIRGEHVFSQICSESLFPPSARPETVTVGESVVPQLDATAPSTASPPIADSSPQRTPVPSASLPIVPPTPIPTRTSHSLTKLNTIELKTFLLDLINKDRNDHGLEPVSMGTNTAAQEHAEEMLGFSYVSHWGLDGLKPYMRYTLAGGKEYEAENAAGVSAPLLPGGFYRAVNAEDELRQIQKGFMESAGHRVNVLNRWHKKVNLGIACSRYACAAVQQFEGDYMDLEQQPVIHSRMLCLMGEVKSPFEFSQIGIWYDPTPSVLALGQLDRTYCYGRGERPVAFVREPARGGSYYVSSSTTVTWDACPSPNSFPLNTPRDSPGSTVPHVQSKESTEAPWTTGRGSIPSSFG